MSKKTTNAAGTTGASRREALRAQQLAEAKQKRTLRILGVAFGVLALALIAVVAVVVVQDQQAKKQAARDQAAVQVTPPNALEDKSGIVVNPGKFKEGAPTLTIYQDYQCPACKSAEDYFGVTFNQLAESGKVKLEYKTMTFLDANMRNDASQRAAIGAACADISGKYGAYHDQVFKNQPKGEGTGYTDQLLSTTIPQTIGIEGDALTKFQACYNSKQTAAFVAGTNEAAGKAGVNTTPTYMVNGKNPQVQGDKGMTDWWRVLEANEDSWMKAIDEIAKS